MLLVTVCLWALNFTASKYILDHGFQPLTYSGIRYSIAALIFLVIVLPREGSLRIERRDLPLVAGAIVLLFLNQIGFVFARRPDDGDDRGAALWHPADLHGSDRASRGDGAARAAVSGSRPPLSFSGVALVTVGSGKSVSGNLGGDLLAIMSAATWGGYSVALAPLMRRYSPYRLSAIFLVVVSIALLAARERRSSATRASTSPGSSGSASSTRFSGPLVVTNLLWFSAIDRVGPSRASLFANLQPFLAAVIALLLLAREPDQIPVRRWIADRGRDRLLARATATSRGPIDRR